MALLICVECGGKVSSYASACPHCGCPAEYQKRQDHGKRTAPKIYPNDNIIETTDAASKKEIIKAKGLKNMTEWREIKQLIKSNSKNDAINLMIRITNADYKKCKSFAEKMERMIGLSADLILQEFPDQVDTTVIQVEHKKNCWDDGTSEAERADLKRRLAYPMRWEKIVDAIKNPIITLDDEYKITKDISVLVNTDDLSDTKEIYRYIENTGEIPYGILKKKYPNQFIKPKIKPCSTCGRSISSKAETCPHCGQHTGVHVCPRCGSTNTHVLTGFDKTVSTALWGRFAANEVLSKYWCEDCRHKW